MFGQTGVTDDPDVGRWLVTGQFAGGGPLHAARVHFHWRFSTNQPLTFHFSLYTYSMEVTNHVTTSPVDNLKPADVTEWTNQTLAFC